MRRSILFEVCFIDFISNFLTLTIEYWLNRVSANSGKSGKSQGIHFTPGKVREKSGNLVKSQGKVREFSLNQEIFVQEQQMDEKVSKSRYI